MFAHARPYRDGTAALHQALVTRALAPAPTPDDWERSIADLLELSGFRREPLEAVQGELQRRLARRTDDFDASLALRLIEGALTRATRQDGPWAWSARQRRRRRRSA